MAVVGFKQYSNNDKYVARRAVNKTMNLVWKVVVTAILIVCAVYGIKYLMPLQKQLDSTINGPSAYDSKNMMK